MITRAYRKNLVIIKNIESDIVEEAYLIIREDAPQAEESALVREAGRIIRCYGGKARRKKYFPFPLLWFLGGMAFAALSSLLIYII